MLNKFASYLGEIDLSLLKQEVSWICQQQEYWWDSQKHLNHLDMRVVEHMQHQAPRGVQGVMLAWSDSGPGPVPPWSSRNLDMYPDTDPTTWVWRDCATPYIKCIVDNWGGLQPVLIQHQPGTHIRIHQDAPEKIKIHIAIETDPGAKWYLDNDVYWHQPSDGSAYLINTRIPHGTHHQGEKPRLHLFFKTWSHYYDLS